MRRPILFASCIVVALIALAIALRFGLWIPHMDAPEMVAPVLSATLGGGVVFLVAVGIAIYAGRRNSN